MAAICYSYRSTNSSSSTYSSTDTSSGSWSTITLLGGMYIHEPKTKEEKLLEYSGFGLKKLKNLYKKNDDSDLLWLIRWLTKSIREGLRVLTRLSMHAITATVKNYIPIVRYNPRICTADCPSIHWHIHTKESL